MSLMPPACAALQDIAMQPIEHPRTAFAPVATWLAAAVLAAACARLPGG